MIKKKEYQNKAEEVEGKIGAEINEKHMKMKKQTRII